MSNLAYETGGRINVSSRIERLPKSKYHVYLTMLLTGAWFVESIDLGGLGYILPTVGKYFNLTKSMMGLVASTALVGMFLGSVCTGSLSDKYGRKKMLMGSMAFWGIAGALSGMAWSFESLLFFRFLLGVGIGAQIPVGLAWLSELVQSRYRGKYISIYQCTLPLGIAVAGLLTYLFLPKYGWQGVLFVEALPAFWLLVIWKFVPESARWLESVGRYEDADRVVKEMEERVQKSIQRDLPPIEVVAPAIGVIAKNDSKKDSKRGFSELLTRQYAIRLIMSAVLMFTAMLAYYGLTMWLSTLLMAKGFSLTKSIVFVSLISLGGMPSFLLVPFLVEKIGRKWSVFVSMVLMAIFAYAYGSSTAVIYVIILGLIFQLFQVSMTTVLGIYVPELWPTHTRVTGTGVVYGVGRVGAIVGPLAMGFIMQGYGPMEVFMFSSVVLLVGAFVVMILGPETKGKVM
ncbi:MAG: arabinose ABC transporter permease [Desulfosporosinus sp. BRH_c37]|nr:MAG: arabinose ABC transporter permease [Desulfosporosinus sp. BRH_c37]